MTEWWTYRLSDFLMFAPRTYWRLVELHNQQCWPAQLLALAAGVAALVLAARHSSAAGRALTLLLALAWLAVGWAFHWERYASINWAAQYFAAACAVQALLLLVAASTHSAPQGDRAHSGIRQTGAALALAGVLLYPLAGRVLGRPWAQAEVFGLMPDPTALVTLGLLLASPYFVSLPRWQRMVLGMVPVLTLMVGAATHWVMAG